MLIRTLTDEDYNEVYHSEIPVVLKFHAAWCGPCKAVMPAIEKLAEEYTNRIQVCAIDIDGNHEAAQHFRIMCVPVIMFIKNGLVEGQIVGMTPNFEYDVRTRIEKMLEGA
jgi:thioredoxin 1